MKGEFKKMSVGNNLGSSFIYVIKFGIFVARHIYLYRFFKDAVIHIFIEIFHSRADEIIGYAVESFCDKSRNGKHTNESRIALKAAAVFDKLQQKLEEQNLLNEAREEPMCRLRKNIGRNEQGSTFADCFQCKECVFDCGAFLFVFQISRFSFLMRYINFL